MMDEKIESLVGRTPIKIEARNDTIDFTFSDGSAASFYHDQDCCEAVYVDDVNGEWDDLLGSPLLVADERIGDYDDGNDHESVTWTFYTFRGIGGSVDVRWCGRSNCYYSERVSLRISEPPQ